MIADCGLRIEYVFFVCFLGRTHSEKKNEKRKVSKREPGIGGIVRCWCRVHWLIRKYELQKFRFYFIAFGFGFRFLFGLLNADMEWKRSGTTSNKETKIIFTCRKIVFDVHNILLGYKKILTELELNKFCFFFIHTQTHTFTITVHRMIHPHAGDGNSIQQMRAATIENCQCCRICDFVYNHPPKQKKNARKQQTRSPSTHSMFNSELPQNKCKISIISNFFE